MDELTVLADLGDALDRPADLPALRARTLHELRTARRPRRVHRPLLMAVAAAATAALIVVPSLLLTRDPDPTSSPSPSPSPTAPRPSTTDQEARVKKVYARLAEKAAATGKPLIMPRPDQYVYVETRDYGRRNPVGRSWNSVDHVRPDVDTDYATGRLEWDCFLKLMDPPDQWVTDFSRPPAHCPVNKRAWAAPTGVPVTPAAFSAWFRKSYPAVNGPEESWFDRAHYFLMEHQLLDSRVTPSLFLMLVKMPDVGIIDGGRDRLGRATVGLIEKPMDVGETSEESAGESWILLFDPRTFAYLGRWEKRLDDGTALSEEAVVRIGVVDRVGEQPE